MRPLFWNDQEKAQARYEGEEPLGESEVNLAASIEGFLDDADVFLELAVEEQDAGSAEEAAEKLSLALRGDKGV